MTIEENNARSTEILSCESIEMDLDQDVNFDRKVEEYQE